MTDKILKFLDASPTAYGAVDSIRKILKDNGYEELGKAKIAKGRKYYVTRNDSSIIVFNVGKTLKSPSIQIAASHTDCPSMKLKPNPIKVTDDGVKLNIEEYGGMLRRAWFDRPLSLAGRIICSTKKGIASKTFIDREPFCIIPSMAPHLDHKIEDNKPDLLVDMAPIVSLNKDFDFKAYLSDRSKVSKKDILGFDLYLYPLEKAYIWGADKEFFSSGHIDNLECAYTTLMGFVDTFNDDNINVYASFDNEEVGSLTRQGADSDLLHGIVKRICNDLKLDYYALLENGMLLSCDNAHGIHPNHPELYDRDNGPRLNEGIVIKYNAEQSYTSDALSSAIFRSLLDKSKIPYQYFANKTGNRGGSTLGNLSNRHVSILSVDIGLAQWAMHSVFETAGTKDVDHMIKAVKLFYSRHLNSDSGNYSFN